MEYFIGDSETLLMTPPALTVDSSICETFASTVCCSRAPVMCKPCKKIVENKNLKNHELNCLKYQNQKIKKLKATIGDMNKTILSSQTTLAEAVDAKKAENNSLKWRLQNLETVLKHEKECYEQQRMSCNSSGDYIK